MTFRDVTEDPFTDLYRVEGLKGIYIASRVDSKAPVANIGPEHLISLITFDHGVTWSPINPPTEDENGKLFIIAAILGLLAGLGSIGSIELGVVH